MQVHEGTKPFKCDTCNAGFTSNKDEFMEEQSISNALLVMLSSHEIPTWVDTWHQFMKERSLSNVTIVIQVHGGTKPFKYDTCNAGFTYFFLEIVLW